jgi:hypothetical protein
MGRPFYGTSHQLGEKGHKRKKRQYVFGWFKLVPVYVYGITQCLKGVKADAHRQYDFQGTDFYGFAEQSERIYKGFNKKVGVFEVA